MKLISNMATVYWFVMPGALFGIQGQGCKFQKQRQNLCHLGGWDSILKSGAQYWGSQVLEFLTMVTMLAPGAGPAK